MITCRPCCEAAKSLDWYRNEAGPTANGIHCLAPHCDLLSCSAVSAFRVLAEGTNYYYGTSYAFSAVFFPTTVVSSCCCLFGMTAKGCSVPPSFLGALCFLLQCLLLRFDLHSTWMLGLPGSAQPSTRCLSAFSYTATLGALTRAP